MRVGMVLVVFGIAVCAIPVAMVMRGSKIK